MLMRPFPMTIDANTGALSPCDRTNIRHLSDMKGMYYDRAAEQALCDETNPLIYSFSERILPEENGHLQLAMTTIQPGKVGNEYHMTKGHYHKRPDTSEIYLGIAGEGVLLMQTPRGDFEIISIKQGVVAYIPPFWGHRMVNTGNVPFIFFAVYPGDAGHNYGDIEKTGFLKIMVERGGKPLLINNPILLREQGYRPIK